MHVVLGGTGHIGSALANCLLARREPVLVVTRRPAAAAAWEQRGAAAAVVDLHDVDALTDVVRRGRRLFALNPPAPVSGDTDTEEDRTRDAILAAIAGSGVEKVVAASTYGAQAGRGIGDLGTLHAFEQGLAALPVPVTVVRSAFYLSNYDGSLAGARDEGVLTSFLPADAPIPMVAPADIGRFAAELMLQPAEQTGLHHLEGPERHSPHDVAVAFAEALGRPVEVKVVPREEWIPTFLRSGFSPEAARSYAGMTGLSVDGGFELPTSPTRGPTTLAAYVRDLVRADAG